MELHNDARPVKSVRVIVHTLGIWPNGTMSDNRWSIYLLLNNNDSSVRTNMRAELDNPKGILEWSPNLAYTLSTSAIQHWDYSFNSGVTVAKVYDLIMGNRRDQYIMSGGGSGCRCYIVIKDLEAKDYLTSKTIENDLWPRLLLQYSNTGHQKKLDMVKGEFTSASSSAASSVSAGASLTAIQSVTGPPTRVTVKSYTANGRLCYSWKSGGEEDRSFAWSTCKDQNGKNLLIHRAKNLVSVPP